MTITRLKIQMKRIPDGISDDVVAEINVGLLIDMVVHIRDNVKEHK